MAGSRSSARTRPESGGLLSLRVLRRAQLSPHFARVTLGSGDIGSFRPLGYDQWFRLFIPVGDATLEKVPAKLTTASYLKFLVTTRGNRPALTNYTVRAYRPDGADGPEIDVDVVLHGSPDGGTAGPGETWARTCAAGNEVGLLDEGTTFDRAAESDPLLLVGDESALPAIAGILASLPDDARGRAVVEVPAADDRQDLRVPSGVALTWVLREAPQAVPGVAALGAIRALDLTEQATRGWVAGEKSLAVGTRRLWVERGLDKDRLVFTGYWRADGRH